MEPHKRYFKIHYWWIFVCIVVAVGIYGYYALQRPLTELYPEQATVNLKPSLPAANLPWPATGESAVGYDNAGVLGSNGGNKPLPTASVAKVITALSVLSQKPIVAGQEGPMLTLSQADVDLYNKYLAEDGSVVPVTVGEQISEYQMLQTMMLPSANNMADSLAIWAFGSLTSYANYANQYVKGLHMTNTHVGLDASGFDPSSVSTASDLVLLGEKAMDSPILSQIVDQPSATGIPNTDSISNVNFLLGMHNIIGVKTGNTDQAGGVYISASNAPVGSKQATIITALIGSPTLYDALANSVPIITGSQTNFGSLPIISAGSIVGTYKLPWGGTVQAVATSSKSVTTWRGQVVPASVRLQAISSRTSTRQIVGNVTSNATELYPKINVPIVLKQAPTTPSLFWRLLHP